MIRGVATKPSSLADEDEKEATLALLLDVSRISKVPARWLFSGASQTASALAMICRTQHPQPVFWGGGSFPPDWSRVFGWQMLAMLMLGVVLTVVRLRQEESQREIDSLRRMAHSF